MSSRLPPLNALRVFEAAAHHLSFTRAAAELFVTQAAVSHQIKSLEESLGVALFWRRNRSLFLTEAGQQYLPVVREALELIRRGTEDLCQQTLPGTLSITVLPSFAARWLVPRLGRFIEAHPDIDVKILPSNQLVDFYRDGVDVGVRFGRGQWPGLCTHRLMGDRMIAVCAPALLTRGKPLREPADLRHFTLLQDADEMEHFPDWLALAGVEGLDTRRGLFFNDASLLIQAALGGQGVGLVREVLVVEDLRAGRLVQPLPQSMPIPYEYFLVYPEGRAGQPRIRAFRDWLVTECQAFVDAASSALNGSSGLPLPGSFSPPD